MLQHGSGRGHSVEQLDLPAVRVCDDVAAALVVSGEHAARHHEVRARTERLRYVTRTTAAAVLKKLMLQDFTMDLFRKLTFSLTH